MQSPISSRTNSRIKDFLAARRQPPATSGRFVVEGEKLLEEVVRSPHPPVQVFVLSGCEAGLPELPPGCEVFSVTAPVMEKLSALPSPPRVVAACARQDMPVGEELRRSSPWLVLDDLQDPGNTGTVFRSAAAFGLPFLVLCGSTPDPFREKVIRASAGASLRLPAWRHDDAAGLAAAARAAGKRVVLLRPRGGTTLEDLADPAGCLFVLGNEGHGVSAAFAAAEDQSLHIPMAPGVESLNAATAASVLLYDLFRRQAPGGGRP